MSVIGQSSLKNVCPSEQTFVSSNYFPIKIGGKDISLYHRGLLPVYIFVYYQRGTHWKKDFSGLHIDSIYVGSKSLWSWL